MAKPSDIASLSLQEQKERAFQKVIRTVNICEISTVKMRRKLESAGYSEEASEYAINRACSFGAIDDVRYSECLIRSTLSSNKGLRFAEKEISELGINIENLDAYAEYSEKSEEEILEAALDILNTHPPKAKNKRDAAFRKLYSKGYSADFAAHVASVWVKHQMCAE